MGGLSPHTFKSGGAIVPSDPPLPTPMHMIVLLNGEPLVSRTPEIPQYTYAGGGTKEAGNCVLSQFLILSPVQGRRRHTKSGPVVGNGGCVDGAAPGSPAQLGGMGEPGSSPIGVWGGVPEADAFCVVKPSKSTQKVQQKYSIRIELNSSSIHLENTTLRHRASAFHICNLAF